MSFMKSPYKALEKVLHYKFRSKELLTAALTHPSYRNEKGQDPCMDNQRLEFLGDAVVGLLAAEHLYDHASDMREGDMTKFRSTITNRAGLAKVGAAWGLGEYLRMGRGEAQSGGATKESNLADAVEAVLGAVYLDGGHKSAAKVFSKHFVPRLETRIEESPDVDNPKGALQEYTQRIGQTNPEYNIVGESGPAHDRVYLAAVTWDGRELARGEGASKRSAEADAARKALEVLQTS
jgi:ribonuclease-3